MKLSDYRLPLRVRLKKDEHWIGRGRWYKERGLDRYYNENTEKWHDYPLDLLSVVKADSEGTVTVGFSSVDDERIEMYRVDFDLFPCGKDADGSDYFCGFSSGAFEKLFEVIE